MNALEGDINGITEVIIPIGYSLTPFKYNVDFLLKHPIGRLTNKIEIARMTAYINLKQDVAISEWI